MEAVTSWVRKKTFRKKVRKGRDHAKPVATVMTAGLEQWGDWIWRMTLLKISLMRKVLCVVAIASGCLDVRDVLVWMAQVTSKNSRF